MATLTMWPSVDGSARVRQMFFTDATSTETVAWTADRLQNESYLAYLSMTFRWSRPGRTSSPVTVVAAERDAVFTLEEQRGLASAYGTDLVTLPGIGHACGHNIIAAAGLGAGIAAAAVASDAGGRLRVLGTPAEEGGGGKVFMAREGALDGLSAAMMVHPADHDLSQMDCIAIQQLFVTYHGRAAHAAAPEQGVNALDAAVLGYMGIAALRQHIGERDRIHGVFTNGGDKPNIVPAEASMHWYVRSRDLASLAELQERVLAALQAGATATGASMTYEWHDPAYADMLTDDRLLAMYAHNAARIGRSLDGSDASPVVGSTDMGNVSHEVPSIHPMIAVAPPGVAIHTPEFAEHARSPAGDRAVLDGAKAMACTVIDAWEAWG